MSGGILEPSSRFQISPNVYARAFGDELVLLDFARGEYFALDPVGADVYRRLEAGETIDEIAHALASRYDVTREAARADVVSLVQEMVREGLVNLSPRA